MASMSRASKQSRSSRAALQPEEMTTCANLLARAIAYDQFEQITAMTNDVVPMYQEDRNRMVQQAAAASLSHLAGTTSVSMDTQESPKRARSPGSTTSDYTIVSHGNAPPLATTTQSTRVSGHGYDNEQFVIPNEPAAPLPPDVKSLQAWTRSMFNLPKFAAKKWSYGKLLEQAWDDADAVRYLSWLQNAYQHEAKNPKPNKASDFVAYLNAVNYPVKERLELVQSRQARQFVEDGN